MAYAKPFLAHDPVFQTSSRFDSDSEEIEADLRERRKPACFMTEQRYFCTRRCIFTKECKKLKAVWLR
ncbi:MAG: hypothetical protein AXA67_13115 [Methylothermaceae bacteria B42]|nr:MAG: hypothetical protein AXA67_13115 [Methylothermaceae bacteria B42]HHJ38436.1 hypothetical protein [Methylothermaceae bacterium]